MVIMDIVTQSLTLIVDAGIAGVIGCHPFDTVKVYNIF